MVPEAPNVVRFIKRKLKRPKKKLREDCESFEVMSDYKTFERCYSEKQLLGEIINLIKSSGYTDFIFVAGGQDIAMRFGSKDTKNFTAGDLMFLAEHVREDILNLYQIKRYCDPGDWE